MKKLVHRLRRHPEHVRQKILFGAMIVSLAVLFALWLLSFSYVARTEHPRTSIKKDLAPFAVLKSIIGDSVGSFPSSHFKSETSAPANTAETGNPQAESTNSESAQPTDTTVQSGEQTDQSYYQQIEQPQQ